MPQTKCLICGKVYASAKQSHNAICKQPACRAEYDARRDRAYRDRRRLNMKFSESSLNGMSVVITDPSGCFERGARLIAIDQTVAMAHLPVGLIVRRNGVEYIVKGEECVKEMLVPNQ